MVTKQLSLLLAGMALLSSGYAFADHHGGDRGFRHGPGMGDNPVAFLERVTDRLDLDEAQQTEVGNVLEAARPEFRALRDRGQANREAMRGLNPKDPDYSASLNNLALESGQIVTDVALLFGRVRAEVYDLLTAEQIAELESMADGWRERRSQRRDRWRQ